MTDRATCRRRNRRATALSSLPRTAAAVLLAAALAACGGDSEQVASAPSAGASASASASAPAQKCPITATEVPAPAGVGTDLAAKPTVKGTATPPPSALQFFDIVEGDGDEAVTGSQVAVKYVGAFYADGKEFDSSWSRGAEETLPFGICQRGVIPGFAVGPSGMKVGGRRQIIIPAAFGYGPDGQPPTIPGNSALVFVVDLVSVDG